MLLYDTATASVAVAATGSRLAKRDLLAAVIDRSSVDDLEIVVSYLAGELRQRRTGIGWATLGALPEPATEPTLTVADVDAAFEHASTLRGTGSATRRAETVARLFASATEPEQRLLRGLVAGDVRQGALDALSWTRWPRRPGCRWRWCAGPPCCAAQAARSPLPR